MLALSLKSYGAFLRSPGRDYKGAIKNKKPKPSVCSSWLGISLRTVSEPTKPRNPPKGEATIPSSILRVSQYSGQAGALILRNLALWADVSVPVVFRKLLSRPPRHLKIKLDVDSSLNEGPLLGTQKKAAPRKKGP